MISYKQHVKPSCTQHPLLHQLPLPVLWPEPATFTGEVEEYSGFLLQCSLYFEMQSPRFVNDHAWVAFVLSLLAGRVLQWVQSLGQSNAPVTSSLYAFSHHFQNVFGQTASELSVHDQLFHLRHGCKSVNA